MENVLNEIQNLPTGNHKTTWVTIQNLITDYAKQFGKEFARQEKQSYADYYANHEDLEAESMKDEPNPQKIQQVSTGISKFERSYDKIGMRAQPPPSSGALLKREGIRYPLIVCGTMNRP